MTIQFMEVHIQPRSVKSSMNLKKSSGLPNSPVKAPPMDEFARKRKVHQDVIDEDFYETQKLVKLTFGKMLQQDNNEQSIVEKAATTSDDCTYSKAVEEAYKSLDKEDKEDGLIMVLQELKFLKSKSKFS